MTHTRATQWKRLIALTTALGLIASSVSVNAQGLQSQLAARREAILKRLPPLSPATLAAAESWSSGIPEVGSLQGKHGGRDVMSCAADSANPLSSLVAREDNPAARSLEGFILRDKRGRHTRRWRAHTRAERDRRGAVTHRPLLVFLETPTERQDFNKPWFGPVRFDRPGFPTTKAKITEQVFGKNFDHRDPESVAGFYFRESGGKLLLRGEASSVHTVLVPHMTYDPMPMVEAILAQLDPIVDFTKRADEFGWVDPIFIMTPYSAAFDVYEPSVMGDGLLYTGIGPTVYDQAPAITNDAFPDGSHAALSAVAISMVGIGFGANQIPSSPSFGLPDEELRFDRVELYAHEYGHNLGLSHMHTNDYAMWREALIPSAVAQRQSPYALNREYGSGFATSIMNYSYGSGIGPNQVPRGKHAAGLDPMNRSKLGWGNVIDVTLTDINQPGPRELSPGDERRLELVEHLGQNPHDSRPQILRVNLPPQQVSLFPHNDDAGNPTGYWRPGPATNRMVWSGRSYGGSRIMETSLRVPNDLDQPVLSFWTKYGAHQRPWFELPGVEFGWVQISTDGGQHWTSLAGQTSSTYVEPYRRTLQLFGDDLGAPAFTGNSGRYGANGWVLEKVPLPLRPGATFKLRFNFSGLALSNEYPSQNHGWWIDDVHLGTSTDPMRDLVNDFEGNDARRWSGLLTEFDRGMGFTVVEETSPFPQTYFFELRGSNPHDEIAFQDLYPKELNGYYERGLYTYKKGIVGYYDNQYAAFWAFPYFKAGSATGRAVPLDREKRQNVCYPYCPEKAQMFFYDFGALLAAAADPSSGLTRDDVAFIFTVPSESFFTASGQGYAVAGFGNFPLPSSVTILDASPTYRPLDVAPAFPQTPFPERSADLWPYVLGAPGGWPKSVGHGRLGTNDPATTLVLGQPFLAHDAAFHPDGNRLFNDQEDHIGNFFKEFYSWHGPTTESAFASLAPSERLRLVPSIAVPVSETEFIQRYSLEYCPQDTAGSCVASEQATTRPWINQLIYQRLAPMFFRLASGSCPPRPPEVFTLETKPAWDAYYACLPGAMENAHQQTNQFLDVARNLSNNPNYSWLNAYGNQGMLNPALWANFYLYFWAKAKSPAPLPSFGFSMEVERITSNGTPKATLRLRRSGRN